MPFESLAVDVTISDDVPSSVNLYISPIGLGHLSNTPFSCRLKAGRSEKSRISKVRNCLLSGSPSPADALG